MKRWIVILIIVLIGSCDLEEEIFDEVSSKTAIQNPELAENFLAQGYVWLAYSRELGHFFINTTTTDELIIPFRPPSNWEDGGNHRQHHKHTWTLENYMILAEWEDLDRGVGQCNSSLFHIRSMEESEETPFYLAELRFIRALLRFWQLDQFRQVPLRNEMDLDFATPPPVLTGKDAFEWIENELKEIIPILRSRSETPYGRVTKSAARMLLTKLYLNAEVYIGEPKWQEALDMTNEVIQENEYQFEADYWDIFSVDNYDNSEAILVIRRDRSITEMPPLWAMWFLSMHYNFPLTWGANGLSIVPEFLYRWDSDGDNSNGIQTTDVRFYDDRIKSYTGTNLGFVMGPQFNPDGSPIEDEQLSQELGEFGQLNFSIEVHMTAKDNEGVRAIKYQPDAQSQQFAWHDNNDFMIFRFADLWLMGAEAKFRLGRVSEALDDINTLRQIRNAPILTSLTEQDILNERGFELWWEGWRRQDQIRFGTYTDAWTEKEVSDSYREVFPIAVSALAANPYLKQNPGY